METFSDRAKKILSHFHLNENSFSKQIGKSYTGVVKIVRGESKPNLDMIESILDAFPQLNPSWLVAGEGEMLREQAALDQAPDGYLQEHIKHLEQSFSKLANQLEVKDKQIEGLQRTVDVLLGKSEGVNVDQLCETKVIELYPAVQQLG